MREARKDETREEKEKGGRRRRTWRIVVWWMPFGLVGLSGLKGLLGLPGLFMLKGLVGLRGWSGSLKGLRCGGGMWGRGMELWLDVRRREERRRGYAAYTEVSSARGEGGALRESHVDASTSTKSEVRGVDGGLDGDDGGCARAHERVPEGVDRRGRGRKDVDGGRRTRTRRS